MTALTEGRTTKARELRYVSRGVAAGVKIHEGSLAALTAAGYATPGAVATTLKHVAETKLFGTKSVWRARTKVPVSDVHRTIIDILDDPAVGGGIRQAAECLHTYLRRPDRDDDQLVSYAERLAQDHCGCFSAYSRQS